MTDKLRIISLQAENIKRLLAVDIRPDGALVEITGENGAGKTSVLDCLWWAIAGAEHIQSVPIRKGADKAIIRLDLGELVVTRRFNKQENGDFTTSIVVENKDGARFTKPQSMLDALVGALTFDPLEFARMRAGDQFEACRRFVPDFDFAAHDAAQKEDFAKRTDFNRRAKDYRAQAEGVTLQTLSEGRRDEAALIAQLEEAGVANADIERRKANREAALKEIGERQKAAEQANARAAQIDAEIERLILEAKAMRTAAEDETQAADALQQRLNAAGALPGVVDTAPIREAIAQAQAHNRAVDEAMAAVKRKADFEQSAGKAEAEAKLLTQAMEARDKAKLAAIAAAKMPVEGLSFGDGAVLLDGLPFEQASDAMRLRASVAIAAAMNPKLRVIRIRDGSLLDKKAWEALGDFARAEDFQVWVETVASDRPGAVVIEDGRVAGTAEKTEAA